jgi:hypothetical protein
VRAWAGAEDEPNARYRDAHVWYDADKKANFTAYKLLIADVVDGKLVAVPRAVHAAAAVMQGSRGGINLPDKDIDRVKSHLAKYYASWTRRRPGRTDRTETVEKRLRLVDGYFSAMSRTDDRQACRCCRRCQLIVIGEHLIGS